MNRMDFMAICAYYYTRELLKYVAYVMAALGFLLTIHKIVSWALWVLSL